MTMGKPRSGEPPSKRASDKARQSMVGLGVRRAKGESFLSPADASFFLLSSEAAKQAGKLTLPLKVRSSSVSVWWATNKNSMTEAEVGGVAESFFGVTPLPPLWAVALHSELKRCRFSWNCLEGGGRRDDDWRSVR